MVKSDRKIKKNLKRQPNTSSTKGSPTVTTGETGKPDDMTKVAKPKSLRSRILPTSGYFCVFAKDRRAEAARISHLWFHDKKSAFNYIRNSDEKGVELFIAQATFAKKGTLTSGRSQQNASYLRNFFMDIDCGVGKPYSDQAEGEKALLSFCKKAELPIPAIVNSGIGLYAHWPLTTEIAAGTWTPVATKLKRLVVMLEPGLDQDGLITDSARVLRPTGSTHRKDPENPKVVTRISDCESVEFRTFELLLDAAAASLPGVASSTTEGQVNIRAGGEVNSSVSAELISTACPIIGLFRETRGNVSEPMWHAAIGVLRPCDESPQVIHEWSAGHPKYSFEETEAKIAAHTKPPTTCTKFAELSPGSCDTCPHRGKIKTPVTLGIRKSSVEIPGYVRALNVDNFVSQSGGKTVVCRETFDPELKRFKLVMSSFSDFRNFHGNRKTDVGMNKDGNAITMPLGKAWLDSEYRRQYEDIKLTPEGNIEGTFNLWRGYSVKSVRGEWTLIRRHIFQVICNSDKLVMAYVLGWLARLIQMPWLPGEVALVLQGKKGIGKGMFVDAFCRIFGQHALQIFNGKHLTGNFNAHLEDCIFLYVDEAFWAGDKGGESVLKGLITEPTIPIERKGFDLKPVRNLLHIIMASNNDWVVPASADERRYCVLSAWTKNSI